MEGYAEGRVVDGGNVRDGGERISSHKVAANRIKWHFHTLFERQRGGSNRNLVPGTFEMINRGDDVHACDHT